MRAKRALAVACVLFGAASLIPPEAAAARPDRATQKQVRPGQQVQPPANARPAAQKPQVSRPAAAPVALRQAPRRDTASAAPRQAAAPRAAAPRAPAPRAAIAPQEQARAALAAPGIARNAFAQGAGTPILPVAATSGLSCVPFARMATGMSISGDARLWWHNAAGIYHRSQTPERGAVLSFPGSGGMSRGHVAVVSRVVNARTIEIDHANWGGPGIRRGTVMRGVRVVDVSDRNDWTAVRVQVGWDSDTFGRTYATHGFIHNRPAGARIMTAGLGTLVEVADAASPHAAQHRRLAAQLLAE